MPNKTNEKKLYFEVIAALHREVDVGDNIDNI